MIKPILLALALAGAPMAAAAQSIDVAAGIQLAQVDFDTYHALLLDRCRLVAPDSVDALQAVMAQWQQRNADALVILRQLYKAQLMRQKLAQKQESTDAELDAHVAAVLGLFNSGLPEKVARIPVGDAKASCEGGYAGNLQNRPDMDFDALLKRMTLGR